MWNPSEHSDEVNLRWSWLRAVEWIVWPLFISQPLVPVLLYFAPWQWIIGLVVLVTFLWRLFVVPAAVSPRLAFFGAIFVKFRFATAPIMAYLIWHEGEPWIAALALGWPFVGIFVAQWVLAILQAPVSLTVLGQASQIGLVQTRFMARLGYERRA